MSGPGGGGRAGAGPLAGLAVERGAAPGGWQAAVLILAALLSSSPAPLPPHPACLCLIPAMLAPPLLAATLATNAVAALYVFLGPFPYGVVYTVWLKRRTWMNIVIGGLAGSFAVLAGAAAVNPLPGPEALALAVVLFLWTPPHFWSLAIACRDDYAAAGVPMLPVVVGDERAARAIFTGAALLVGASLVPAAFGLGWIYLAAALSGGAWFLLKCRSLLERPGRETARASFRASLVQLSAVLLGAMVDVALR